MTAPHTDPRHLVHAGVPLGYLERRTGFLSSTIRRPTDEDAAHDAEVDRFARRVRKARAAQPADRLPRPDAITHARLVAAFVATQCEQRPGAEIGKEVLHVAWSAWVRAQGYDPLHMARLAVALKTAVPELGESRLGREQTSRWRGLQLRDDAKQGAA